MRKSENADYGVKMTQNDAILFESTFLPELFVRSMKLSCWTNIWEEIQTRRRSSSWWQSCDTCIVRKALNLSIHRQERRIARNKAPRFVADAVVNGCAVTGPHSTEPRMRDATHSIVFYILPGVSLPPFLSSSVFLTRSQPPAAPNAEA